MRLLLSLLIIAAALFAFAGVASAQSITYQGWLGDAFGNPLTGSFDIDVRMYDDPVAGSLLWTESFVGVQVTNGRFTVELGKSTAFNLADFVLANTFLTLEINNDGEALPRLPFTYVPYAFQALHANEADTISGIGPGALDALYVNESGDSMSGALDMTGNNVLNVGAFDAVTGTFGAASVTGALTAGTAAVTGNATVGGDLTVTGTSNLGVLNAGATTLSGVLDLQGNNLVDAGFLNVLNDLTITGNLFANTDATIAGLTTTGTLSVTGAATVGGALSADSLAVTNGATVGGNLGVTGNGTIGGTLDITGLLTATAGATLGGPLDLQGNNLVDAGNTNVLGTLDVTGVTTHLAPVDLSQQTLLRAIVHPDLDPTVNLAPAVEGQIAYDLTNQRFVYFNGTIWTLDAVSVGGSTLGDLSAQFVDAAGDTMTGALAMSGQNISNVGTLDAVTGTFGSASVTGAFSAGATTVNGALSVTGAATIGGLLDANGGADVAGGLNVTGGLTTDTVSATGNATIGGTLSVTGTSTLTGAVAAGNGLTVTGLTTTDTLIVNATVNSDLDLGGTRSLLGAVNVNTDGLTVGAGGSSFGSALDLNSNDVNNSGTILPSPVGGPHDLGGAGANQRWGTIYGVDVDFNGTATFGNGTFTNLTVTNNLDANGTTSLSGDIDTNLTPSAGTETVGAPLNRWAGVYTGLIDASGNATIGGIAAIGGNATVAGTLGVTGTTTSSHVLPATAGTDNIGAPASRWGTIYGNNLNITGASTFGSGIFADLDVTNTLSVTGVVDTNLDPDASSCNLGVGTRWGTAFLTDLDVANDGDFGGVLTVTGTSGLTGAVTMSGGATVTAGGLSVTGGTGTDTLNVTGNATVGGTLDVTGATTSGGLLPQAGDDIGAALNRWGTIYGTDLNISGTSTFANGVFADLDVTNTLSVTGAVDTDLDPLTGFESLGAGNRWAALFVGNVDATGTLNVVGASTLGGGLAVTGNTATDSLSVGAAGGTFGGTLDMVNNAIDNVGGMTLRAGPGFDIDMNGNQLVNLAGLSLTSGATLLVDNIGPVPPATVVTFLSDVALGLNDLTTTGLLSGGTLSISGASTFGGAVTITAGGLSVTGGTSTDTLATTGNATVGGTLDVTGTTTSGHVYPQAPTDDIGDFGNPWNTFYGTTLDLAGNGSITGSLSVGTTLSVSSTTSHDDTVTITAGGLSVTGGTATDTLSVTGLSTTAALLPQAASTHDIGAVGNRYGTIYGDVMDVTTLTVAGLFTVNDLDVVNTLSFNPAARVDTDVLPAALVDLGSVADPWTEGHFTDLFTSTLSVATTSTLTGLVTANNGVTIVDGGLTMSAVSPFGTNNFDLDGNNIVNPGTIVSPTITGPILSAGVWNNGTLNNPVLNSATFFGSTTLVGAQINSSTINNSTINNTTVQGGLNFDPGPANDLDLNDNNLQNVTSITGESVGGTLAITANTTHTGTLDVTGAFSVTATSTTRTILPEATITYDLGSLAARWNAIYTDTLDVNSFDVAVLLNVLNGAELDINAGGLLQVNGALTIQGTSFSSTIDLGMNDQNILNVTQITGESIGGTLGLSANTTVTGTLDVTAATALGAGLTVTGNTGTDTLSTTGNATVGGTLAVTGLLTANGGLTVADAQTMTVDDGISALVNGSSVPLVQAGTATLVAGTVTINTATITADSIIVLTHASATSPQGVLAATGRVGGAPGSFTIVSSSDLDTNTVDYIIIDTGTGP